MAPFSQNSNDEVERGSILFPGYLPWAYGLTSGAIALAVNLAIDLLGNYAKLSEKQLIVFAKVGMLGLTLLSSWLACLELPALFSLAVMAYQGIIQLAVPQFLGIFWKRGNKQGAIAGMTAGFVVAVALEIDLRHARW